jgi:putative hydroxymethylpyrimidine transport system permease protein
VIGEWIGASKGLGYLMLMANARSKADLMFAALVLVVAMTLTLRALVPAVKDPS